MKATELIAQLQAQVDLLGDVEMAVGVLSGGTGKLDPYPVLQFDTKPVVHNLYNDNEKQTTILVTTLVNQPDYMYWMDGYSLLPELMKVRR